MVDKVSDLIKGAVDYRNNPAAIQDLIFKPIEDMLDDEYDVVDPNNPFVFVLETASYLASAAMVRSEALSRKQYPRLAQTYEDLYHHMSDEDFLNRFSTPAPATFKVLLSLEEIKEKAIPVAGMTYRKMTIPRDTQFEIDSTIFTLTYPIEIRVLSHGGIQIVYDTTERNPIRTLSSNVVDWEMVVHNQLKDGSGRMVLMHVPAHQFNITSYTDQLNQSTGFARAYAFTDKFYYARVWTSNDNSEWSEIKTTHSDQVYDKDFPTALLTVVDQALIVTIPQIYFSNGTIGRSVRVDVYTTRGELYLRLDNFQPDAYAVRYIDLKRNEDPANAIIRNFSNIVVLSTDIVNGGTNGLTFEELRTRVINRSLGSVEIPITDAQLKDTLNLRGYDIVKYRDSLTNRTYLATREMPSPSGLDFTTPVGSTIKTLQSSFNELATHRKVKFNGDRLTIESGTLFELDGNVIRLVNEQVLDVINSASAESKTALFNTSNFFTTPFHYVLDATENVFESRAFYLDRPSIESKEFVSENSSTGISLTTMRYAIERTDTGYEMVVVAYPNAVGEQLDETQVHAILSVVPPGEYERANLKGNVLGRDGEGNFIIQFNIDSNLDIDKRDRLYTTSFKMFDNSDKTIPLSLDTRFDLFYAVTDYMVDGIIKTEIDEEIPNYFFTTDFYSVTQERFHIVLGKNLNTLWTRARSVIGENDYERHETDGYATYPEPVYVTDPVTGAIQLSYDEYTQQISFTKLHEAGDPIIVNGQQELLYRKGDLKLINGEPIIRESRQTLRQVDLLLLEGIFSIVTDTAVLNYYNQTRDQLTDWVTDDIPQIANKLHENTDLWFYPKGNVGNIVVYVGADESTTILAEQSLNVKIYLTASGSEDEDLKQAIQTSAKDVIKRMLAARTVSTLNIANQIATTGGDEVMGVVVSGLGGAANYELLTLRDEETSLSVRKQLYVLADGTITIDDAITFDWVKHSGGA